MKIVKNSLLNTENKTIEFSNNCIIAKDGPYIVSKINLSNLNIKYDSVSSNRVLIKSKEKIKPIIYGTLGTNITFLAMIPTYSKKTNNIKCDNNDYYLEYFFENEPLNKYHFTDILVLSGNKFHKIPQLYIYNPLDSDVFLDIMMANVEENDISDSILNEDILIKNLTYNSIRSDQYYFELSQTTGSTQLEVYDIENNLIMSIPYNMINNIDIQNNNNTINIKTNNETNILLNFISSFNMYQALSRINYAIENYVNVYLTKSSPTIDTTPPQIIFKTNISNFTTTPKTKEEIIDSFIEEVRDYDNDNNLRDGIINKYNISVTLFNTSTYEVSENIDEIGTYNIYFQIKDKANNNSEAVSYIIYDNIPPVIVFKNVSDTLYLNDFNDEITKNDLLDYFIDTVYDLIDSSINKNSLHIHIFNSSNNSINNIVQSGDYLIKFLVSDICGNQTIQTRNIIVN